MHLAEHSMSGDSNRRVIPTTCTKHRGTPGFTNSWSASEPAR